MAPFTSAGRGGTPALQVESLKTAEGLEDILQIFQVVHKSRDGGQQHQRFEATVVRG